MMIGRAATFVATIPLSTAAAGVDPVDCRSTPGPSVRVRIRNVKRLRPTFTTMAMQAAQRLLAPVRPLPHPSPATANN
ncbi:MAG: hypothetical protein M0P95_04555 [Sulfuritalea sp.]|jgi:hypothetical protein|nr:hypothetical protein [Sulfuritalea sp.]